MLLINKNVKKYSSKQHPVESEHCQISAGLYKMMTEDMITTRWHYRLLLTVYKLPLHHLLVFLLPLASVGLLVETQYQPLLQGSQSKTRNGPTLNEVLVNCTIYFIYETGQSNEMRLPGLLESTETIEKQHFGCVRGVSDAINPTQILVVSDANCAQPHAHNHNLVSVALAKF